MYHRTKRAWRLALLSTANPVHPASAVIPAIHGQQAGTPTGGPIAEVHLENRRVDAWWFRGASYAYD